MFLSFIFYKKFIYRIQREIFQFKYFDFKMDKGYEQIFVWKININYYIGYRIFNIIYEYRYVNYIYNEILCCGYQLFFFKYM